MYDIFHGAPEQHPHLFLGQPDRLVLQPNVKLRHAGLVELHDLAGFRRDLLVMLFLWPFHAIILLDSQKSTGIRT